MLSPVEKADQCSLLVPFYDTIDALVPEGTTVVALDVNGEETTVVAFEDNGGETNESSTASSSFGIVPSDLTNVMVLVAFLWVVQG